MAMAMPMVLMKMMKMVVLVLLAMVVVMLTKMVVMVTVALHCGFPRTFNVVSLVVSMWFQGWGVNAIV